MSNLPLGAEEARAAVVSLLKDALVLCDLHGWHEAAINIDFAINQLGGEAADPTGLQ